MSCGLGQLIPYFECQYPTVVPGNSIQIEQAAAAVPVNSGGVGDYVDPFAWPIPQYLTPGNNKGLGCMCGGSCCGGMGALSFISPDGYFQGGPSEWGAAEYGTILGAVYLIGSAAGDTKRLAKKGKGVGKKAARKAKSGVSIVGVVAILAAAGLALYIWGPGASTGVNQ